MMFYIFQAKNLHQILIKSVGTLVVEKVVTVIHFVGKMQRAVDWDGKMTPLSVCPVAMGTIVVL